MRNLGNPSPAYSLEVGFTLLLLVVGMMYAYHMLCDFELIHDVIFFLTSHFFSLIFAGAYQYLE